MKNSSAISVLGLLLGPLLLGGCARTSVVGGDATLASLPRPPEVLVYDFVASPDDVRLGSGLAVHVIRALEQESPTEAEVAVGRKVSAALSEKLVERIGALGIPARRAASSENGTTDDLIVRGHFLSIDQGNRRRRILIGLGAGASDVKTSVQVYQRVPSGRRIVDQFEVDSHSGRKPGAAETMGIGAAAGAAGIAAGVGAAGSVASEAFGANVEADAARAADRIAEVLERFFRQQGWIGR